LISQKIYVNNNSMKKIPITLASLTTAFMLNGQPASADEGTDTRPYIIQDMTCQLSWQREGYDNSDHCRKKVSPEIFRVICEEPPSEAAIRSGFRNCFLDGTMASAPTKNSAGQRQLTA
jgi:hypothetical protein